jgi:glucose 1-dehydrogenase
MATASIARDPAAQMTNKRELDGQWAVVVGASRGIGFGIAEALLADGGNVVLVARSVEALEARKAELAARAATGQRVLTECADASDPSSMAALFGRLEQLLPRLNIYVANAGMAILRPLVDISLEEWNSQLALNLTGTFVGVQWAARRMLESASDANRAILVVSSVRALSLRVGLLAYSTSKAAVNQLARAAALELAPHGIRVNTLSPGLTLTETAVTRAPDVFASRLAEVPLRRAGSPADMGAAVRYLCGPSASFVTGTNLMVDGGQALSLRS